MATRTVPLCLEMLTGNAYIEPSKELLGHFTASGTLRSVRSWNASERSWNASGIPADARRAYGYSHSAFMLGNAYIEPPKELLGALHSVGGTSQRRGRDTAETPLRHRFGTSRREEGD